MIKIEPHKEITTLRLARRLPGLPPYFTTCHVVDGLMVDSGCAHTARELLAALDREGIRPHTVVNTHRHEDHIAGNAALHRRHNVRILAHALALPVLADPRRRQPEPLYRRVMWGYPEPSWGEPIDEGEVIETEHHRFQVLHTPGHSPDHLCLFEPERGWLFSGDLYIRGEDRGLRCDSEIWEVVASLRRLLALDASLLLPGSGSIQRSPRQAIERKIAYLERTGQKVLELHARGMGLEEIRARLFGRELLFFRVTQGDFNGKNLVRSFVAGATRR